MPISGSETMKTPGQADSYPWCTFVPSCLCGKSKNDPKKVTGQFFPDIFS